MFEVLMFLFENYMNGSVTLTMDDNALLLELEKLGFERHEIGMALDWLGGMVEFQAKFVQPKLMDHAIRHYAFEETERLGVKGKGFLFYLEQMGILDPVTREVVLDRIMVLDPREMDLGRLKWIVLMVLFSQPQKKPALLLMQEMVLADAFGFRLDAQKSLH